MEPHFEKSTTKPHCYQSQQSIEDELGEQSLDEDSLSDSFFVKQQNLMKVQIDGLTKERKANPILGQIRDIAQNEAHVLKEYSEQVSQLHGWVGDGSVVKQQIISFTLAEVSIQNKQKDKEEIQKVQNIQIVSPLTTAIHVEELKLNQKLSAAAIQRQILSMSYEDQLSKRIQNYYQHLYFQRQKNLSIIFPFYPAFQHNFQYCPFKITDNFLPSTPVQPTEDNILPKNSPELALKALLNKKTKFKAITKISKLQINPQQIQLPSIKSKPIAQNTTENDSLLLNKKQNIISQHLKAQIQKVSQNIKLLLQYSKQYQPSLFKLFLSEEQNTLPPQVALTRNKKDLSQIIQQFDAGKLKDFKFTLEGLQSAAGIEQFRALECLSLSFNCLQTIKEVASCFHLIQIDVSHNKISEIQSLSSLKCLRLLKADSNRITKVTFYGGALQILSLAHNLLVGSLKLSNNKYLHRLDLGWNALNSIEGLEQNYFLQTLIVNDNKITSLCSFGPLLKNLNLSNNCISQLPLLCMLHLRRLLLTRNCIVSLSTLILPCLQFLDLQQNRIENVVPNSVFYLPNLKQLLLNQNAFQGLSTFFTFLPYSANMQIIKYDSNQYFLNLRQKQRQFYQYILVHFFPKLQIINQNEVSIGLKQYYFQSFQSYLKKQKIQKNLFAPLIHKMTLILAQASAYQNIFNENKQFSQTSLYISKILSKKVGHLEQIINILTDRSMHGSEFDQHIFYSHDSYEYNRRKAFHKIRSLLVSHRFRKRHRMRYFQCNSVRIAQRAQRIHLIQDSFYLRSSFYLLKTSSKAVVEQKAAKKIQRAWRRFAARKKFKRVMNKWRRGQENVQIEEIDIDFCDNQLNMPEFEIDFEEWPIDIIKPQVFDMLEKKNLKTEATVKNKVEASSKESKESAPKQNNFIISEEIEEDSQETQLQKIMADWGFKDKAPALAMLKKIKKKQAIKQQLKNQNMTATQRYDKFKKGQR